MISPALKHARARRQDKMAARINQFRFDHHEEPPEGVAETAYEATGQWILNHKNKKTPIAALRQKVGKVIVGNNYSQVCVALALVRGQSLN